MSEGRDGVLRFADYECSSRFSKRLHLKPLRQIVVAQDAPPFLVHKDTYATNSLSLSHTHPSSKLVFNSFLMVAIQNYSLNVVIVNPKPTGAP